MKKIIVIGILLVLCCCLEEKTIPLNFTEVREYQGEQLSSAYDFRENSIAGVQHINISTYTLSVTGQVEQPKKYKYEQVLSFQGYSKVVQLDCVEGWSAKILWEGILLKDLIAASKPTSDANTVVFHSYDGYTTSLSLDYIQKNNILLAYKMNNATIIPERGYPFIVVAEDKWGYKWAKWVVEIELSNDPEYKGFWESRGYNNNGSLDRPY